MARSLPAFSSVIISCFGSSRPAGRSSLASAASLTFYEAQQQPATPPSAAAARHAPQRCTTSPRPLGGAAVHANALFAQLEARSNVRFPVLNLDRKLRGKLIFFKNPTRFRQWSIQTLCGIICVLNDSLSFSTNQQRCLFVLFKQTHTNTKKQLPV